MDIDMDPKYKQVLDDVFDAFLMLAGGQIVSLMHVRGNYTRYTPAAVDLFGFPGEYIKNGSVDWGDYLHPEDRKRYMDVMGPLITGESKTYDITYRVRTTRGVYQNFRAVGAVIREENGRPDLIGGMLINQGMTETTDPVTVLPNKAAYRERLSALMAAGKDVLSLQVGVSRMAEINQMHGYTYGNRLLQEVAWLIQEVAGARGEVFRTDGATFVLLTEGVPRGEVAAIYDMISYRMQRGIQVNGIKNILSANGGLVSTHGASVGADTAYSCLRYAYEESKDRKHGALVDFNGSINYDSSRSLELLNTIRDCVADDCRGFSVVYEPVVSAADGRRTGAEAAAVWSGGDYGTVEEADFIPVLERDFLFEELGEFVIRRALDDGVAFARKEPDFQLCLNVYRIQLESDYFVDGLLRMVAESGFPERQLSLKFTGDCRYLGVERLRDVIGRLHGRGILAIIDGFGSGSDSILFLKDAPVDAVSLDARFLDGVADGGRDRDILDCLTRLAATCVKHINVKGVRSAGAREALRGMPVTTMQGPFFSVPLTRAQVLGEAE